MNKLIEAGIRCSLMFLVPALAYANSAQWDLNPTSGDWNTAANWTPMTVPNGPADIATFALSSTTNVSISANTEVNGITFTPAATNPYTITASPGLTLTISGVGITNNSGSTQNFVAAVNGAGNQGEILFTNGATAGSSTTFTNQGAVASLVNGGFTAFADNSTAGNGTFINNGSAVSNSGGGFTTFGGSSSAANGTFINNAGTHSGFLVQAVVIRNLSITQLRAMVPLSTTVAQSAVRRLALRASGECRRRAARQLSTMAPRWAVFLAHRVALQLSTKPRLRAARQLSLTGGQEAAQEHKFSSKAIPVVVHRGLRSLGMVTSTLVAITLQAWRSGLLRATEMFS